MTLEKGNEKSLRITAMDSEKDIKIYLIMVSSSSVSAHSLDLGVSVDCTLLELDKNPSQQMSTTTGIRLIHDISETNKLTSKTDLKQTVSTM